MVGPGAGRDHLPVDDRVKQSGWGREMGHEVLEAYTEVKAVTAQL